MANHKSAEKAARQATRHAEKNRIVKAKCKTVVRKVREAVGAKKPSKEVLIPLLNEAQSVLMRAAGTGVIKMGTASRKIARLSQAIQRVS